MPYHLIDNTKSARLRRGVLMRTAGTVTTFHNFFRGPKNGMAIPLTVLVILILALLGFSLYNYLRSERNIVARLQYASVADKMAQSAAQEAACWFNLRAITMRDLLKKNELSPAEKFVLLPVTQKDIEGKKEYMTSSELMSYEIASEINCRIDSVELKYSRFKSFFLPEQEGSDYAETCYLHSDPYERAGGLVITARATYKNVTRVFCCRYEIKITNMLLPVISKFTLFSRGRDNGSLNQIQMMGEYDPASVKYGQQGIAENDYSRAKDRCPAVKVPLIVVNHPADVATISGYAPNHLKMREYLPMSGVGPVTSRSYKPDLMNRGWIFLGNRKKGEEYFYLLNLAPGFANPDVMNPYDAKYAPQFYGEGFQMLESDIAMLVNSGLKGNYPYAASFVDSVFPEGVHDFIIRLVHSGVYWIAMSENKIAKRFLLRNYYDYLTPELKTFKSERSSLLHLYGDIQPLAFSKPERPSKYLDRRSPTIVLGKVWRSYLQIGTITQNCIHPDGSPGKKFMETDADGTLMHKLPYEICPYGPHPKTAYLPFFRISSKTGILYGNVNLHFSNPTWGSPLARKVTDSGSTSESMFANVSYDVRDDVFNCPDRPAAPPDEHLATYKTFMSKVIKEIYNRGYGWTVANSYPDEESEYVLEPGSRFRMKKDVIKILESTEGQEDEKFFNGLGGCYLGANLRILQQKKGEVSREIFERGLFAGSLISLSIFSPDYRNPLKADDPKRVTGYDIRQKSSYIFNNFEEFKKNFGDIPPKNPGVLNITEGGVFYIDSDETVDMTAGGKINEIKFYQNVILICKKDVMIPNITKSEYAVKNMCTMSVVSSNGSAVICGGRIEASVVALGPQCRITKNVDYFQIFGNLCVNEIDLNTLEKGNIFTVPVHSAKMTDIISSRHAGGAPAQGYERISVTYDPSLDPCDQDNYMAHYSYKVASKQTYWRTTGE